MDNKVNAVLDAYAKRAAAEDELTKDLDPDAFSNRRDEFLISIGPAAGQLLNLLIKEAKARTIVEIGASYGYSALWLAEAARETGGTVISLELSQAKIDYARDMLGKAGLADFVEFRIGDARQTLAQLSAPVDFVLIDLWKDLYIPCLDLIYPKLSQGAFIAADNMLYPERTRPDAQAYRKHIRAKPHIESVLLPVGNGIELSRYADDQ